MARSNVRKIVFAIGVFVLLLLYTPIIALLSQGLHVETIVKVFSSSYYYKMFGFTVLQALLSTVVSVGIGLPSAYLIARYNFKGKSYIKILGLIPFVCPSILVVLGFVTMWGNNGMANRALASIADALGFAHSTPILPILYTLLGIILAHSFYNYGIAARIIAARWATMPSRHTQAAQSLGANNWRVFKDVVLPYIAPSIRTSAIIIFLFCFTSFAIVLVLGGGPWNTTLEVAIYRLTHIEFQFRDAAVLALVQMCTTLAVSYVCLYSKSSQKAGSHSLIAVSTPGLSRATHTKNVSVRHNSVSPLFLSQDAWWGIPFLVFQALLVTLPFISIIVFSMYSKTNRNDALQWNPQSYIALFKHTSTQESIWVSIRIALLATCLAVLVAFVIAVALHLTHRDTLSKTMLIAQKFVQMFLFLPYFISPIILSFSYVLIKRLLVTDSLILLIVVHALLIIPLITNMFCVALEAIPTNIVRASYSLGAHKLQSIMTIYLPLTLPSTLVAVSLGVCLSLGELSASIMLVPQNISTIPLQIYSYLQHYRFLDASRMGVILIVLTICLLLVIDRVGSIRVQHSSWKRFWLNRANNYPIQERA